MYRPPDSLFLRKLYGRLKSRRIFRWTRHWFVFLIFLAVFGDFIANDIPLYCKYQGKPHFPVMEQMLSRLRIVEPVFNNMTDWSDPQITNKIYPLIPYHYNSIDRQNSRFVSPFKKQEVPSWRYRHWLGTDQIGRDLLAGLIHGARISMTVGIAGMALAALIGIFLGSISGFFGNHLKQPLWRTLGLVIFVLFWAWMAYALPLYLKWDGQHTPVLIFVAGILIAWLGGRKIKTGLRKRGIRIPADALVLRLLEIFNSIPKMLLVLVMSIVFPPSVGSVALIIGITHWPAITRYIRSEMLKLRKMPYLEAARIQNIPRARILLRYSLPVAMGPALVAIMIGVGQAILAEAFLSFLGLGLPPDVVSWGSLLAAARLNLSAWWLAVFPGIAIFLTVYFANRTGELLLESMKAS